MFIRDRITLNTLSDTQVCCCGGAYKESSRPILSLFCGHIVCVAFFQLPLHRGFRVEQVLLSAQYFRLIQATFRYTILSIKCICFVVLEFLVVRSVMLLIFISFLY